MGHSSPQGQNPAPLLHSPPEHNITQPFKVRNRFYFKRACLYPARQNNLGCAKEASQLATGPQKVPTPAHCDSAWCEHVTREYKVKPGSSWGIANKETQKGWFTHKCSAPKEQDLSGCPGAKNLLNPLGLPKDQKYDANAGVMGGSGRL